ncbi:MAG: 2,3-bisphosphoglycerate-independent phosphoglycerate mutase [Burkholderiales bacterium]
MNVTPVLLIILDGFGYREACDDNAICQARKPHWNFFWRTCPHTTIDASEQWVGLPQAQMGNSEVGHLNIGAGRVIYQDYTRIEAAIASGEFFTNPVLKQATITAVANRSTLHILGLLSPGGVHSHEAQIGALVEMAARAGVKDICVHAFLDGRDTPPRSALASLAFMRDKCAQLGAGRIASIVGRYYAMDRDQRWERVQAAYDLITQGTAAQQAPDAITALEMAYARGENDEFVQATAIVPAGGTAAKMNDGDVCVFMNFRADRARQMTRALTDPHFNGFKRARVPQFGFFCTLTSYGEDFKMPAAYGPQSIANCFGEYVAKQGLRQLRIAETEKYAHVTYFFNGGVETPYAGEERVLVPSPKVATYDLKPEMSAFEVTDKLVEAIQSRQYAAIVCNYANGDMVGHTGNLAAATRAIEVLDECLGRVIKAMQDSGGEVLITADHGNAEMMHDKTTHQAHTAHTLNVVPLLYIGRKAKTAAGGALQDVAPTLLRMMGLAQPPEMSAFEITDKLVAAIRARQYDAIVCNYANGDMVGHTGNLAAATRAIEVLDECLGRVIKAMQETGGEVLITADHGNAEQMHDKTTQQAHTAHTLNVVPLLYIGRQATAAAGGALEDVAPTLLKMMGLAQPAEMTGKALIDFV